MVTMKEIMGRLDAAPDQQGAPFLALEIGQMVVLQIDGEPEERETTFRDGRTAVQKIVPVNDGKSAYQLTLKGNLERVWSDLNLLPTRWLALRREDDITTKNGNQMSKFKGVPLSDAEAADLLREQHGEQSAVIDLDNLEDDKFF